MKTADMEGALVTIAETRRLLIRRLTPDDAEFILQLLNEPSFLQYIGDKGVRTLDDARNYILSGPVASYLEHGFGLFLVLLKENEIPIGMCGLLKRVELSDPDIGFAFLPAYWSKGYAFEASTAVMDYGRNEIGINRIVAITSPDNDASGKLLEKLGLKYDKLIRLTVDRPEVKLFTTHMENQNGS